MPRHLYEDFRDDELTEYPETEYEDPAFNSSSTNVNNGNGLFSGKGAAKGIITYPLYINTIRV